MQTRDPRIQLAVDELLLRRIEHAGPYVAALLGFLAATKPLAEAVTTRSAAVLLAGADLMAAGLVLFVARASQRQRIRPGDANAIATLLIFALALDSFVHMAVLAKAPEMESITIVILLLVAGVFHTRAEWLAVTTVLLTVGWVATGLYTGMAGEGWLQRMAVHAITALAVAATLHVLQVRTVVGLERMRAVAEERSRKLEVLAADLQQANSELEAFAYSASHDIRAPLRHVRADARALLDDHAAGLGETGRAHAGRIAESSARLEHLVQDLLDLSRVTRVDLKRANVDLAPVAREIIDELRHGDTRSVDVRVEAGSMLHVDPSLFRIALQNLLGNAWKFTRETPGARIEIGAEDTSRGRALFVRDNGVGFPASHAAQLFQPFRRLPSAAAFEGTGVGLTTVQRIARRHGGEAWAMGAPGAGATFWVSFGE